MQNNVKRMLAYSSIAHAGYALVGFIGAGAAETATQRDEAIAAVAFYMLTYAVTNLGAFAIVTLLSQKNDRRAEFEDYNGIGFRAPVLSFTLSLFMVVGWLETSKKYPLVENDTMLPVLSGSDI